MDSETKSFVHPGLRVLQPFLLVRDVTAAKEFYKEVFGAVEEAMGIRIGDCTFELSAHDGVATLQGDGPPPVGMHLYVEDVDGTVTRAVQLGAKASETEDMPYGDREGGFTDPFGIPWYIATYTGKKFKRAR